MVDVTFGYSTNAYTRYTLTDAIREIGSSGFDGVELLADRPHLPDRHMSREEAGRIREVLNEKNLAIANINCNTSRHLTTRRTDPDTGPTLLHPDPDMRHRRIRHIQTTLRNASRLGAACLSISTGPVPPGTSREHAVDLLRSNLERIMEVAAREEVKVGIEFEPGHHLETARDTYQFVTAQSHDLLGINLDVGHCYVAGEDPVKVFREVRDRVWHLHLEDIADRQHEHLIPGEGDIPLKELLAVLQECQYGGFCTLELYPCKGNPTRAGRKGLDYLHSLLDT